MSEQFMAWRDVKDAILSRAPWAFEMILNYTEEYGYSQTLAYYYATHK